MVVLSLAVMARGAGRRSFVSLVVRPLTQVQTHADWPGRSVGRPGRLDGRSSRRRSQFEGVVVVVVVAEQPHQ